MSATSPPSFTPCRAISARCSSTSIRRFRGLPTARHEAACASGSIAVLAASAEIEAGRYDLSMVVGVEQMKTVDPKTGGDYLGTAAWYENEAKGIEFPFPKLFGKLGDEYDKRFGLKDEHLARISAINYGNAKRNPLAQTRNWYMTEPHANATGKFNTVIGGRIKVSDCSQVTDGAVSLFLASETLAAQYAERRNLKLSEIPRILGWGHRTAPLGFAAKVEESRNDRYVLPHTRQAILDALRRAGMTDVWDVQGIETHDCFTTSEYMAIDHFGLTEPGESWKALDEGVIEMGGRHADQPERRADRCGPPRRGHGDASAPRRLEAGERARGRLSGRERSAVRHAEHRRQRHDQLRFHRRELTEILLRDAGRGSGVDQSSAKVPPHSLEAEAAVLGGILLDNTALDRVAEHVSAEDFYREAHRKIFRAASELSQRSEPIDLLTLTEALKTRGELAEVGGAAYVSELADRALSAANIQYHARIIREKAILRGLIATASEIVSRGYEAREEVARFVDEAEQAIYQIAEKKTRGAFTRVGDMITETFRHIEQLYERKEMVTGVATGFTDLDRMTAGLQPSDLIIVAGRPSMGKTSFCLNIAEHVAIENGTGVAVFSLEMSKEQLVLRMLCSQARVDLSKVRTGFLAQKDFPRLAEAAGRIHDAPIYVDDTPALSALELRAKARRLKRDKDAKLGLIIVDYLQLMRGSGARDDSREQEISQISGSLKALAKELRLPVIALSQLNRQVEGRNPPKPRMADLRESGAIEQDADVIAFIYRDELYNPQSRDQGVAEIIIAKQRNGPVGDVRLAFRSEYTRFENFEEALPDLSADGQA